MEQTQLIVELARQIEEQQAYHQVWFWLLLGAISGVAGAIGAFGSSYFGKRGDTRAIQADLRTISNQQATMADAVGRVESEISHEDWRKRELTTLRREKLERLLEAVVGCAEWIAAYTHNLWFGSPPPGRPNPLIVVQTMSDLYFRELTIDVDRLSVAQGRIATIATGEQSRRGLAAVNGVVPSISAEALAQYSDGYRAILAEITVLRGKIPTVMNTILGEEFGHEADYTFMREEPTTAAAADAPAVAEERPSPK